MEKILESVNNIWDYKDFILSKVSLVSLMDERGIDIEEKSAGIFTHRAYCPFHFGKDGGKERTPSLFISTESNTFYCFGCFRHGNAIDFIKLFDGTPSVKALEKMAFKIGL